MVKIKYLLPFLVVIIMLLAVGCDFKKKTAAISYTNGMLGTANINGTAYAVALKNNFA